jgi:hypothetical protein
VWRVSAEDDGRESIALGDYHYYNQLVSDQTKVAQDIDDVRRALSAWYDTKDGGGSDEWLHAAIEGLLRAVATLARRVDQLEDAAELRDRHTGCLRVYDSPGAWHWEHSAQCEADA